jgi:Stress responsive A/B Barrel Domain
VKGRAVPDQKGSRRLQHVVLLDFPEPLTDREDAELRAMVASWPEKIGTMSECRIGSDLTGARTRGYDYLLLTVFPDQQTMQAYVAHPVHRELVDWLDARGCQRLAFDYYIDEA